jgi:hypothetical protein
MIMATTLFEEMKDTYGVEQSVGLFTGQTAAEVQIRGRAAVYVDQGRQGDPAHGVRVSQSRAGPRRSRRDERDRVAGLVLAASGPGD